MLTGPSRGSTDLAAAVVQHRVAGLGDQLAFRVGGEAAVAGVALAAGGLNLEEALAVDGEVEVAVGLGHRALA
jgi:hypothetical protein